MTSKNRELEPLFQKLEPRSKLLRAWQLKGGTSAHQVTAFELSCSDGQTRRLVVREHGKGDLARNPNIAADEFKLLGALRSAGVAAPAPLYLDQSYELLPRPFIVIEYIEGSAQDAPSDIDEFTRQLAASLAKLHGLDRSRMDLPFLPERGDISIESLNERPARPDDARAWDRLRVASPVPRGNRSALLHGDFWPGNVLWRSGELIAIIDWEDAAVGDPLSDLANGRLELLWAFGIDAMNRFTKHYKSIMTEVDLTNLPCWDLYAYLRLAPRIAEWGLDSATQRIMRERCEWFVAQAIAGLSGA